MSTNPSAGVYVREIDKSQVVAQASTSVGAIVGESNRGPVNKRVLVTSVQSLIQQFGKPDPSIGFMHQTALAFLAEADRLYVTRVAPGALTGGLTVSLGDTSLNEIEPWLAGEENPEYRAFRPRDLFHVYAIDPGEWNQTLTVQVFPNTKTTDGSFYLQVFEGTSAVPVESYLVHLDYVIDGFGVQLNVMEHINRRSALIRIQQNFDQADYAGNPSRRWISAIARGSMFGGTNGTRATTGNFMSAWDLYSNPEEVAVNLLINAGITHTPVQLKMAQISESRMDCMAILDVPAMEQGVQQAIDYRRQTLNLNSSYAALYGPDVRVLDTYNNRQLFVPPSGYVAAAYARTDREYETWFAPAGLMRGTLKVLGLRHVYNQGDRDALVESQINPIRMIEGIGISIWGADTMQTMKSALSNVNVRRLMLFLETSLAAAALYSVFDPHDEILRSKLTEMCERFLTPVKNGRGLHAFGVVCDETNNPPEVVANGDLVLDVWVDPVLPAKRILLQAVINKTGARFTAGTA